MRMKFEAEGKKLLWGLQPMRIQIYKFLYNLDFIFIG